MQTRNRARVLKNSTVNMKALRTLGYNVHCLMSVLRTTLSCFRGSRRRRCELLNIQDIDFEVELTGSRY